MSIVDGVEALQQVAAALRGSCCVHTEEVGDARHVLSRSLRSCPES